MKRLSSPVCVLLVLFIAFGTVFAQTRPNTAPVGYVFGSLAEFAAVTEGFSILDSILRGTDLGTELRTGGPFVLIAPSDEAFSSLSEERLAMFLDDPDRLTAFLRAYVLRTGGASGPPALAMFREGPLVERSLDGTAVHIERHANGGLTVAGTPVTSEGAIAAGNGTILIVDTLLQTASAGAALVAPGSVR